MLHPCLTRSRVRFFKESGQNYQLELHTAVGNSWGICPRTKIGEIDKMNWRSNQHKDLRGNPKEKTTERGREDSTIIQGKLQ